MAKRALTFDSPGAKKQSKPDDQPTPLSPGNIKSTSANATIHALIASVSPLRPSKYFDGEITDGDTVIRMVGFDKAQKQQLDTFCHEKVPISLQNCQIQRNKYSAKLEVVLKSSTKIQRSPVEFEIADMKNVGSPLVPLCDLNKTNEYDRVTIRAKIIKAREPQTVKTGKTKQDYVIADATGKATLTVWESYINSLQPQSSYQLNRLQVRIFMGKHYLSIPVSGTSFDEISDVENLDSDSDISEDEEEFLKHVTIVGVQHLDTMYTCMNCKTRIEANKDKLGTCLSCNTTQHMSSPKQFAKLFIKGKTEQVFSLHTYYMQ